MPFSRNKFSKTEQSKGVLCELKVSIPHYSINKDTLSLLESCTKSGLCYFSKEETLHLDGLIISLYFKTN